jgi:hypothetical protein
LLEQQRWIFYLEITGLLVVVLFASYKAENVLLLVMALPGILAMAVSDSTEKWYWEYFLERNK